MVEHKSVVNTLTWRSNYYQFDESDTSLQFMPFVFDGSVTDIFTPLISGSSLVLINEENRLNLHYLQELIRTNRVTRLLMVPNFYQSFLEEISAELVELKSVTLAGESFTKELVEAHFMKFTNVKLYNENGPTENSVCTLVYEFGPDNTNVFIGKPINNVKCYIISQNGQLQPFGVPGELCISGVGLARGYLNNQELTEEKFIRNSFIDGERLYRTGDLARLLPDGNIEFLGRIDHQVKIRGFRIELGEIENLLQTHDQINKAVVIAIEKNAGNKFIVAYFESETELTSSQLKEYLVETLPEYMIPSYFVQLDQLPLTPNGKINKKALPEPDINAADSYVAPETELEKQIVGIWAEVLKLDPSNIGIETNFFEIGGHSINAFQIINKIQNATDVMLTIPQFFAAPTIRQLAKVISDAEKVEFIDLEKVVKQEFYPLSSNQKRLWTLNQLDPESPAYNISGKIELKHQVNEDLVKKALAKIIERHESFRTEFRTVDGEVVQFIKDELLELPFDIIDISTFDQPIKELKREEIYDQVVKTTFDLANAPLMRAVLIKVDENNSDFIFNMHHIISDGWSLEILQREFSYYYEGYLKGQNLELEPVAYQYKDFAVWHNQQIEDPKLKEKSHQFWKEKLESGFPVLELPADFERTFEQSNKSAGYRLVLTNDLKDQLKKVATQNNTTIFMVMFSAYNVLLSYLSNQIEFVSGIASAGRDHMSLQNIVGLFTTSILQKTSIDHEVSFTELLHQVDQDTQNTLLHQSYPLELVLDDLKMRFPQISVFFNMLNMFENAGLTELDSFESEHIANVNDGKFDLELYVIEFKNGITINWNYKSSIFKPATIEYIVNEYLKLLHEISLDCKKSIKNYNLFALKDIEIKGNLIKPDNQFVEVSGEGSYCSIVARFEEQVSKYSNQIAVKTANQVLSYNELNNLSNQIGRKIIEERGEALEGVALLFEHDAEMIAGIIGTLKSGKYYIPLDPTYPTNRLQYMLKDSKAGLILTNDTNKILAETLVNQFDSQIDILNINAIESELSKENIDIEIDPENLAYILYTSGSTGTPKGVMQNHQNVLHFNRVYTNNLRINSTDRLTLLSSYGFDAAVMDIYGALLNGATLYPYNLKAGDISNFVSFLSAEKITIYHSIPTVYRYLIDEIDQMQLGKEEFVDLRLIVLGGEAVNKRDVDKYKKYFPGNCIFINGLGPTESTVTLQYFINKQTEIGSKAVPVGYPVEETEVYLIDENNEEARVFGSGELVFKSDYLAVGYLNNPAKTEEVFVTDPLTNEGRVYRTGDLGRRLVDGSIEFIGRRDFQVKVRGYRIEPGEIEDKLLNYPTVKKAVVISRKAKDGNTYLCAYVVSEDDLQISELREYLGTELPDYMIPAYFVKLNELPLTRTGKVDRKALPEVDLAKTGVEYVAPKTAVEKKLIEIWAEVLDIAKEKIGVYHNFFELGGHSLKATKVISNIHKELNVKVPLADFFKRATIRGLADYIQGSVQENYSGVAVAEEKEYYALSSAQKRLYILQELQPGGTTYNMPTVVILKGDLNQEKVEETFSRLLRRHESLRTSFEFREDQIVQIIDDTVDFKVEYHNCTTSEVDSIVTNFIRPFDLTKAPLMRAGLIKVADAEHILMLDMHHIISDGTSSSIFVKDFMALYDGEELAELRIQYKDFAEWQGSEKCRAEISKQEEYWLNEFTGEIPVINLPTDYQRPAYQSFEGGRLNFTIDAAKVESLKELTLNENATLYITLLAIYNLFLAKISGQDEIIVGTPVAGRRHADLQDIVGLFINTLALKNLPSASKTFSEFMQDVKEQTLKAFENQEYQFEDLVEKVDVNIDTSRNPLFDVFFVLQNMDMPELKISGLTLKPYSFEKTVAKFDLNLIGVEIGGELGFTFEYRTKLFKEETIQRFVQYFEKILTTVTQNPEIKLADIEIISEDEKIRILSDLNDTERDYPQDKTLHQLFAEQVQRTPDQTALIYEDEEMTYLELDQRANQVARALRQKNIHKDQFVGIMVERSFEMVIGLLGILKAGAAYLPIDPTYPKDRIAYMLSDTDAQILLTQSNRINKIDFIIEIEFAGAIIDLQDDRLEWLDSSELDSQSSANDLVYIIYTSGSTGKPKGVMVEHKSVVNTLSWRSNYYQFDENDTSLQFLPFIFDGSVTDMFTPLISGSKVVLINEANRLDLDYLKELISQKQITRLLVVPNFYKSILEEIFDEFVTLKSVTLAGESFTKELVEEHFKKFKDVQLYNEYGPTENSVCTSVYEFEPKNTDVVIGKPIQNVKCYIINKDDQLQPIGLPGELCLSGVGLARGYLNNQQLTEEKFVPSLLINGERLYRTGDLARLLPDGKIDLLGRIDDQVKIRGFRIELGEIEKVMLENVDISKAAVIAIEKTDGNKFIAGYFASEKELVASEIRESMTEKLPDYMIPAYFVQLAELPLTPNGKIDRKALPEPEVKVVDNYVAPETELEKKLVEIWSEVLKLEPEKIGIATNFFEMGGHSLRATKVISSIHKELKVKVPLPEFFKRSTIRRLADYIQDAVKESYSAIEVAREKEYYALSSAQKRMYILQQLEPNGTAYNMSSLLILKGDLRKEKVEETFRKLLKRHQSLRTSFEFKEEQIVQMIHDTVEFAVEYHDCTASQVENIVNNFIRPFDLAKAPLMRTGLIKVADEEHILMLDMHHIIADGSSISIFVKEFMALYGGEELPELRIQYKDFAEWQQSKKYRDELSKQEEYWLNALAGEIPVINLPTDYQRPAHQSFEGGRLNFTINTAEVERLKELTLKENATLYITLLAIYNVFLAKISGQEEIIVGTPVAGRRHADLEEIVGLFINTLALRNTPASVKTFAEFLQDVKEQTLKVFENQEYQFEDLIEKIDVSLDASRNPIFDVFFVLQNMDMPELKIPGLTLEPYSHEKSIAKFDLSLVGTEIAGELRLTLEYRTKLFKEETIKRFTQYFAKILTTVTRNPEIKLADIEMISEDEKTRILSELNDTEKVYPEDKTLHQLFAEQVQRTPDQTALVYEDEEMTYLELDQRANQLARALRQKNIQKDQFVGIMVERSFEMVIGLLGILKAGGAYLPIDPAYPKERIAYMLKDTDTEILLTNLELCNNLINQIKFDGKIIDLQDQQLELLDDSNLESLSTSNDLAYIIYTSGSTGQPKGVMIEHRSIVNTLHWRSNYYGFDENDAVLQILSFAFDSSVEDIFTPLISGSKLVLVKEEKRLDLDYLKECITQHRVTHFSMVPNLYQMILEGISDELAGLKSVTIGGESVSSGLVEEHFKRLKNVRLCNEYGPTENSVCTTVYEFGPDNTVIYIGKPIQNVKCYIINKDDQLQPIGLPGELCISGVGLARGYLNNPKLTEEKFVSNSFIQGERIYRTGDCARLLSDGMIDFVGRIDNQVKVRGFRIELGEIESKLLEHQQIKETVVLVKETKQNDKFLVAYFVANEEVSITELKEYLALELPHYMIPTYFIMLDKMPLTRNGKVDRKALPDLDEENMNGAEYLPPTNETEELLVKMWSEILGIEKIGIGDNFFELGGHSLKATTLMTGIRKEFGVQIPLQEIFVKPTISKMSEYILKAACTREENSEYYNIPKVAARDYYPLSSMQKNLFIFNQKVDDTIAYNMPGVYQINGELDKERFEKAVQKLVNRHESLRTSFRFVKGEPVQIIHQDVDVAIQYLQAQESDVQRVVKEFIKPFDLNQAPLFRVGLLE